MASRVALMRLGWGYAMLGPPIWTVMLHTLERSAEQKGLTPILTGAGVTAIVVSLALPELVRRARALRASSLPKAMPAASEEDRAAENARRDARAFEIYLVTWVLALMTAAIPGMVGLMLGVTGHEPILPHVFCAAGFLLTALRFPTERALQQAVARA